MKKDNPFAMTFGLKPENYISRATASDEIISNFENSKANNVYIITGVRGSGKTVLLTHISNHFRDQKDWIVIELVPASDMLEQFASRLYDASLLNKFFSGKTFGFSFAGASFSISGEKPITNVITLIEVLLEKLKNHKKNVLVCIDEASASSCFRPFVQTFQLLLRKNLPVYLLMTGLFQNIYELQNDKTLTFLYRAPKINLSPLNINAIAMSYATLFHTDQETAIPLAKMTKGYAYAYQVLGNLLWEKGSLTLDQDVLSDLDQHLEEYVYEKVWSELSFNDKKVLQAFRGDDEHEVQALLRETGFDKKAFSVYRDRLIKRGLLVSSGYGRLMLLLPRFHCFMQTRID